MKQKDKDLDQKIADVFEQVLRKEKVAIHLEGLEEQILKKRHELHDLEMTLEAEQKELENLDKTNLRSLFVKLLGKSKEYTDRSRQEYLLAIVKVDNCRNLLTGLQHEKEVLKTVQSGLFGIEKKLETLLRQKDLRISQDHPKVGKEITQIDQRILNHKGKIKELEEAIEAGRGAHALLETIIKDLSQVIQWSLLDYGGKGAYSSYKKKRFIDKASNEVIQVSSLLLKYEEELHDVSVHFDLDYHRDIHYYQDFLDTFYDNLITDFVVRKKIKNSISGVETTLDRVEMTNITLQREIKKTKQYIKDDKALKRQLLLDTIRPE